MNAETLEELNILSRQVLYTGNQIKDIRNKDIERVNSIDLDRVDIETKTEIKKLILASLEKQYADLKIKFEDIKVTGV